MTRVDFYQLPDKELQASMRFACRLSLRALGSGMVVHVQVDDEAQAEAVDELMWDYPKNRLLPHTVIGAQTAPQSSLQHPVHIGWREPSHDTGLLINLGSNVPNFFGRFDRVAEIIVDESKALRREHYTFYRQRGYPLHHHALDDWEK
jgi:DNA polymerase-3 subunit chi